MSTPRIVNKALDLLRNYPRVATDNIRDNPGAVRKIKSKRGQHGGNRCGFGHGGQTARMNLPRLGYEGGQSPFYLRIPHEPYYKDHHLRRQYPPLSLFDIQRLIDKGMLDQNEPIDLTSLCNTKLYKINVHKRHYGVNLTEEGADIFCAKVNIEVQWTTELVIATIEKNGGTITTAYFDPLSLLAMINPLHFFKKGVPIPRRALPPEDALEYYSDAKFRGYLADPDKIRNARYELSQKYGYRLPNLVEDPQWKMLAMRKDPRQIFYGLNPGWVINLKDEVILKPTDEQLLAYYQS